MRATMAGEMRGARASGMPAMLPRPDVLTRRGCAARMLICARTVRGESSVPVQRRSSVCAARARYAGEGAGDSGEDAVDAAVGVVRVRGA